MTDSWRILYNEYNPEEEPLREALCALGNGYFVTRGAAEECLAGSSHYPGTYLAGGYNRLETEIAGRVIENEDLVNWPNWLVLKFKIDGGPWLNPENTRLHSFRQQLNLREGILKREMVLEDTGLRRTRLVSRRLVSMADHHMAGIQWDILPENWSGKITVHSALDGTVTNKGVERYRALKGQHLEKLAQGAHGEDCVWLTVRTVQSEITMAQAARLHVSCTGKGFVSRRLAESPGYIAQEVEFGVEENKKTCVEKIVAIFTSRDNAISNPLSEAKKSVARSGGFGDLQKKQQHSWAGIWQHADTVLQDGKSSGQKLLRLHIFHLFQSCSLHTTEYDAGVPARGWHGEAYRGHILWDELFIFPFLNINLPELTRSLLMYRYRRLPEARYAARKAGHQGAMFPWQSGSNGREESQHIHLNPQSGRWIPDETYLQRHVNAAIAYNLWHYYQVTNDIEFLSFYGAEIMLSIARFWASKAEFNREKNRYEIRRVVGPDEYHTRYPGASEPGINNNAYTNVMASWTLTHARAALDVLDERRRGNLMTKLEINQEDLDRWHHISRMLYVSFVEEGEIIEQFEGFHRLKDLDWEQYRKKYGEILRLDRILEQENDSVDNYKAVKQADVLMLFYLFSSDELRNIFEHLNYKWSSRSIPANIAYYQPLTSHGSTLSKLVYSWVLARSQREKSWRDFSKALVSDFEDIQGGTTSEGIHLGAMAGTVDLIQRCYTGMEFRNETLRFNPMLPSAVKRIKFMLRYRGHNLQVDLDHEKLRLKSLGGWQDSIPVRVNGQETKLIRGDDISFDLRSKHRDTPLTSRKKSRSKTEKIRKAKTV